MNRILYDIEPKRHVFSGHETFPLRYGWLKKVYDSLDKKETEGLDARSVFNDPEAISCFGVGKNMVASMRHWALYTGILENNILTEYAHEIFSDKDGLDPWMEHPTTLWRIHWKLALNPNLITYHWFFNYYNGGIFDRKFINDEIIELCTQRGWKIPSATTLKRDVECFIRMYAGKDLSAHTFSDDAIESPLSELSLIRPVDKHGFFIPNRGRKSTLSVGMFMLATITFWKETASEASLSLEAMLYDPTSPGRIFLLDEDGILEKIHDAIPNFANKIDWSETAGMRQLTKSPNVTLEEVMKIAEKLIKNEYKQQ